MWFINSYRSIVDEVKENQFFNQECLLEQLLIFELTHQNRTFEDNFQLFSYTLRILKTDKVIGLQRHFSRQPQKTLHVKALKSEI